MEINAHYWSDTHYWSGIYSCCNSGGKSGNEGSCLGWRYGAHSYLGIDFNADLTVITTVLGITAAQLQADFVAGQALATIAGVKTPALIAANA